MIFSRDCTLLVRTNCSPTVSIWSQININFILPIFVAFHPQTVSVRGLRSRRLLSSAFYGASVLPTLRTGRTERRRPDAGRRTTSRCTLTRRRFPPLPCLLRITSSSSNRSEVAAVRRRRSSSISSKRKPGSRAIVDEETVVPGTVDEVMVVRDG